MLVSPFALVQNASFLLRTGMVVSFRRINFPTLDHQDGMHNTRTLRRASRNISLGNLLNMASHIGFESWDQVREALIRRLRRTLQIRPRFRHVRHHCHPLGTLRQLHKDWYSSMSMCTHTRAYRCLLLEPSSSSLRTGINSSSEESSPKSS